MYQIRRIATLLSERIALATTGDQHTSPAYWRGSWRSGDPGARRLVFVCTGNICRSAYAHVVASSRGLAAASCGTDTVNGRGADHVATLVAAERGVALDSHRTTRWEDMVLRPGDVLIAAQLHHARVVRPRAEASGCHVVTMTALLGPRLSIVWDPYGKQRQVYQDAFDKVDEVIGRIESLISRFNPGS